MCVYGWKQHKKAVPRDANSPTVSTESVLITETIDVHEGRDVGIWDILCDFLRTDIDKDVKMELSGMLA